MVFTSCQTSYNVLSHSHVLNQGLDQIVLIRRSGSGAKVRGVFVDIGGGAGNAKERVFRVFILNFHLQSWYLGIF